MKLNTSIIKKLIKNHGTSIYQFSKGLDICPATLHNILNGKTKSIDLVTVLKIMRFFGIRDVYKLVLDK